MRGPPPRHHCRSRAGNNDRPLEMPPRTHPLAQPLLHFIFFQHVLVNLLRHCACRRLVCRVTR